jgi:hypothetical protein
MAGPKGRGIEAALGDSVTELLGLSRKRAAETRERHVLLASELYAAPRGLLTDAERSLMTGMIDAVIESIAAHLRNGGTGQDERAAAGITAVLRRAGVLADPDLIEAAYHRLLEFQLERRGQKRDLVSPLIERASMPVTHAVTEFMVWRAKRLDAYQNPVLVADELPGALAHRLAWAVAAASRNTDPGRDDALEAATLRTIATLGADDTPATLAARRLIESGTAGSGLLAPLLEAGEIALFTAMFARLARLSPVLARRFLFEPGGESLAVCAKALDLGRGTLSAILEAGRAVRRRDGDIEGALALHDRLDSEVAHLMMRRWSRLTAYQEAMRRLEG